MMKSTMLAALFAATALFAAGCGGEGAVGDECGEAGVEDGECENGAICGKSSDSSDDLTCLEICIEQEDCAVTESCNGVEGTNVKACRVDE